MPAAAALIGITATAVTSAVGSFVASAIVFGVNAGINKIGQALSGKKKGTASAGTLAEMSGRLAMGRSPAAPRRIIYGTVRVSGSPVYVHTTGSPAAYEHFILPLAGHEIESVDTVYIDGEAVSLSTSSSDSNGIARYTISSGNYSGKFRFKFHVGTDDQSADADLVSETSGTGDWTTDHKLSGIAYVYVRRAIDPEVFPNGSPTLSFKVEGAKLYDPRTSTTTFGDNPALALGHYLALSRERGGVGSSTDEINDTAWQAAANKCEESVTIDGGSEDRYTCNGVILTSDTPADNLLKLTQSMAGWVDRINGEWYMEAGQYNAPTVTLTESDFRGAMEVSTAPPIREQFNGVKGVYIDLDQEGQPVDFPRVVSRAPQTISSVDTGADTITITGHGLSDGDRLDLTTTSALPTPLSEGVFYYVVNAATNTFQLSLTDGGSAINLTGSGSGTNKIRFDQFLTEDGERKIHDVDYPLTTSPWTAQRLAAIDLIKSRLGITVNVPAMFQAWKLQPGDTCRLLSERYGWTSNEGTNASFTVNTTTDRLLGTHGRATGDAVKLTTTGTLPAGLEEDTIYFVNVITASGFQVGRMITGEDGSGNKTVGQLVDITDTGTGTHTWHLQEGKVFQVEGTSLAFDEVDGGGVAFGVDLSLRETVSTLYDWDYNDAESVDAAPDTALLDPFATLSSNTVNAFLQGQVITANWSAVEDWGLAYYKLQKKYTAGFTVTPDHSANDFTASAHGMIDGAVGQFTTTGTLPTGLSLSTDYYLVQTDVNDFKVATETGGSAVSISDNGTGTHTFTVDWFTVYQGQSLQYFDTVFKSGQDVGYRCKAVSFSGQETTSANSVFLTPPSTPS